MKFEPQDMTNELINRWLQETRGLPITLQLTKLGFAVIQGLQLAFELGRKEGYDQRDAAIWEQMADEHSGSLDEQTGDDHE